MPELIDLICPAVLTQQDSKFTPSLKSPSKGMASTDTLVDINADNSQVSELKQRPIEGKFEVDIEEMNLN